MFKAGKGLGIECDYHQYSTEAIMKDNCHFDRTKRTPQE